MTHCVRCGGEVSTGDHRACRDRLVHEPPRFCGECGRRMVVQVTPFGWTARCSRHGEITSADGALTNLADLDRRHVWHPYAPLPPTMPPYVVDSAQGVRLRLRDGRELVDGMSSWWAAIHGYRHPALDAAAVEQLGRMSHVMFGGLTHEPAIRLAERLVAITPAPLEHVFFCDSGSVAVEVGIKMAVQFWQARGRPEKTRLLALRGGYHGDTFAAMSVCDPVTGMHHVFSGAVASQVFAPTPPLGFDAPVDPVWVAEVERLLATHSHMLAAVVAEPVVQGAGGMRFANPAYVAVLRRLCDEHDVLLLLDEIATGFGRTGAMFAADHAGVAPDIMCVGKALTGGYLTLAATLTTPTIAEAISAGPAGALLHGPTFMANPLACAVALANLDLLATGDWQSAVRRIEGVLRDGLEPARSLPGVADVRVLGAIGVIELEQPVDLAAATEAAVEQGVWLRPFNRLVYTMPPYVSTDDDVDLIVAGMLAATKAGTS